MPILSTRVIYFFPYFADNAKNVPTVMMGFV